MVTSCDRVQTFLPAEYMPYHPLAENFRSFFGRLNPNPTTVGRAAREHQHVTELIEDRTGPAAPIAPVCFLQGSYKQQTAIHDINDVDVVALCRLWYPAPPGSGEGWGRDRIFGVIAAALQRSSRYAGRLEYGPQSMCIKVNGEIKVEVLPVVFASGTTDESKEPFKLYRPEQQLWEDGYARYHQYWLTWKNAADQANGNFIPAIKVFKHIRTRFGLNAVSFHIECLLFRLANNLYYGDAPDYLANLLSAIANTPPADWHRQAVRTPCEDRDIFTAAEWSLESWVAFHQRIAQLALLARGAVTTTNREQAIEWWQTILGADFFPHL